MKFKKKKLYSPPTAADRSPVSPHITDFKFLPEKCALQFSVNYYVDFPIEWDADFDADFDPHWNPHLNPSCAHTLIHWDSSFFLHKITIDKILIAAARSVESLNQKGMLGDFSTVDHKTVIAAMDCYIGCNSVKSQFFMYIVIIRRKLYNAQW